MPTIISGTRAVGDPNRTTTSSIYQAKRIVDMADKIALLQPSKSPLLRLLSGGSDKRATIKSASCSDPKFQWLEDDLQPEWSACTAIEPIGETTIAVTTGTGTYFTARDLVVIPRTGEVLIVSSVATSTITISTALVAATAVGDELLIIGNASEEGATAPTIKTILEAVAYNYTQIFRTPFGVTKTLKASTLYGGSDLAHQRMKKGIEHARSIEKAFLFGKKAEETGGTNALRHTGGVLEFASTYNQETGYADIDEDEFNDWLRQLFIYGSDKKVVLCSGIVLAALNAYARDKLVINAPMSKKYGFEITEYFCPFGLVYLVHHKLLTGTTYGGYAIGLDLDNLRYRYLNGNGENRDTKLITNIQANSADSEEDEYLTECGLEMKLPATHGTMTGITGTA